jgi:hypothetical protein
MATGFTINVPPSTAPYFVVQYRTLTHCRWQLGADSHDHKNYGHVLTQTQSGTFAVRPRGPLGVITVRLKPEGAARLARASMRELMNVKIGLGNIFRNHDISLLEEQVMEARSSSERIARVESFRFGAWEDREDPVFSRASRWLRRNPGLRIRKLAPRLISASGNCAAVFARPMAPARSNMRGWPESKRSSPPEKRHRLDRRRLCPWASPIKRI